MVIRTTKIDLEGGRGCKEDVIGDVIGDVEEDVQDDVKRM